MSTDGVDKDRRRFWTAPPPGASGAGTAYVLAPSVMSREPSAQAQAAGEPVEADIRKHESGPNTAIACRGKPVSEMNRTEENLKDLPTLDSPLRTPKCKQPQQPSYATNEFRARAERPHHLVTSGVCPQPALVPAEREPQWKGAFLSPCHGSRYDLSGRVFKGVPAPLNLEIPPYGYLSETKILVDEDEKGAA